MTLEELIERVEAESPSENVKRLIKILILQSEFIQTIGRVTDKEGR